jgi:hypothetical protein
MGSRNLELGCVRGVPCGESWMGELDIRLVLQLCGCFPVITASNKQ